MAVPGADGGTVGPDAARSTSLLPTVLAAVSAVVVLACLVVLGVRAADAPGSFGDRVRTLYGADPARERAEEAAELRDEVRSLAGQFVIRVNTYGPDDLDAESTTMPDYIAKVKEVITPKFAVSFEDEVPYAAQSVARIQLERTAEVYATGAETVEDDVATVLVAGQIDQSYLDPRQDERVDVEPRTFRVRVEMVRTGGAWLVDDFAPVTGETAEATDPTDPTGPGATPGPGDPTGAPASPVLQRYAEIIANRRAVVDDAVAALDSCRFPAPARGAQCVAAPQGLVDAARVLVASLRSAADPDSPNFVAAPPQEIADLVTATQAAGVNVLQAAEALPQECLTATSAQCARQRQTFAGTQATLLTALRTWESL